MKKEKTSQKIVVALIDIAAVIAFMAIIIFTINRFGSNSTNIDTVSNDSAITDDLNVTGSSDENLANNDSYSDNNNNNDSSENASDNEDKHNNSTSGNTLSDNSISDNSISDNSLSDNSISDNTTEIILSYAIPNAPSVMNNPSGTVITLADIDVNNVGSYFIIMPIPDDIYEYINGRSYTPNSSITLDDLRYIKVLHYNFEHQIQVGEIIVNAEIANEIKDIFLSLFYNGYEIQSMYLPDRYWTGDGNTTDTASCDANNTSGFFYRTVDGTNKLSNHAMGKAIDINPQQNPYVSYKTGSPDCKHENALIYIDRTTNLPHVITENDLCYQLFVSRGYTWGGAWNSIKDYQHFEK